MATRSLQTAPRLPRGNLSSFPSCYCDAGTLFSLVDRVFHARPASLGKNHQNDKDFPCLHCQSLYFASYNPAEEFELKRIDLAQEIRSPGAGSSDFSTFLMGGNYDSNTAKIRIYPDRTPGGDRHHRSVDLIAVAGRAEGPGSGQSHAVLEQLQADGSSPAQLPRYVQTLPAGLGHGH